MENQGFTSPINPHFFQPLLPGFPNHFIIPVKFFLKHIEGKNENSTAKLRSDISHKTWKVKLDGRRFTDGWEDFAANHDFRVGDIVVFRQEGDMVFHVTGFGPSCCNLQYDITGNIYREKNMEKNLRTEAGSPSNHSCFVAHVTVSNLRVDTLRIPSSFAKSNGLNKRCCEIVLMNEHGRSWTLYLRHKRSSDTTYIIRGWRSFCHANGQNAGSFFTLKLVRNGITPELQLSSTECGHNCYLEKHSGAKEMTINSKKRNSEDRSSSGACSKINCETKSAELATVAKATDQMANAKQNIHQTLATCEVIVKEEQNLGASWHEFGAFECNMSHTPERYFRANEIENNSRKRGSRDERSSGECLQRKEKKTRLTWRESSSPRENPFVTLTLTPYSIKKSKMCLPTRFMRVNGIKKREIILMDKSGEKRINYLVGGKKGRIMLGKGWKGFCEANNVSVGESFVLKLIWEETTAVLMFCNKIKT